ncbi:MAG: T9SS type A sorting domain-containing protein, partial [Lewinella sp.]
EVWQEIVTVPGGGTSDELNSYFAVDGDPHSGLSYYRIRQTDYDGNTTYSEINTVWLDRGNEEALTAYPNPFHDQVTVTIPPGDETGFMLFNGMGQDVLDRITVTQLSRTEWNLDFGDLPNGTYVISSSTDSQVLQKQ